MLQKDGKELSPAGKRIEDYRIIVNDDLNKMYVLWGEKESWFYFDTNSKKTVNGAVVYKGLINNCKNDKQNPAQCNYTITIGKDEIKMTNGLLIYRFYRTGISIWAHNTEY